MKPPKFASASTPACAALAGSRRTFRRRSEALARATACQARAQTPTLTLSEET
ncbi:hypothetical protein CLU85_3849 [Acidovorax sp. 69]|uniref:hypothetical protein n=1 Tax=Acidovorax sp. 69 TaxID=2035202 RepID=UPI000CBFD4D6|nr:hypothetical protein [Acidovorax sp. 69]PJI99010.1 hypothetical protein CLU85_3849 [Acidovorax sp. 69]